MPKRIEMQNSKYPFIIIEGYITFLFLSPFPFENEAFNKKMYTKFDTCYYRKLIYEVSSVDIVIFLDTAPKRHVLFYFSKEYIKNVMVLFLCF